MSDPASPNRDQAALWNAAGGRAWAELQEVLDAMYAPFATAVVDAVEDVLAREHVRVLDVGCGAGATTLAMARRLGGRGSCVGVDLSLPLLSVAERRAAAEGLATASFVRGDAQTYAFDPDAFDAVISRFGVMFFDDPEAAFANLRRAARSGGKLAFAAWRSPADNPFMTIAPQAAAPYLPALPSPSPGAPGPFAFADPDRVRRILTAAGWTDVDVRALDATACVTERDLHTFVTRLGPVGRALADVDEATRARVTAAVHAAFAPHVRDGAARFTCACWLATARR